MGFLGEWTEMDEQLAQIGEEILAEKHLSRGRPARVGNYLYEAKGPNQLLAPLREMFAQYGVAIDGYETQVVSNLETAVAKVYQEPDAAVTIGHGEDVDVVPEPFATYELEHAPDEFDKEIFEVLVAPGVKVEHYGPASLAAIAEPFGKAMAKLFGAPILATQMHGALFEMARGSVPFRVFLAKQLEKALNRPDNRRMIGGRLKEMFDEEPHKFSNMPEWIAVEVAYDVKKVQADVPRRFVARDMELLIPIKFVAKAGIVDYFMDE